MTDILENIFATPHYQRSPEAKQALLLQELLALTQFHMQHCPPYAFLCEKIFGKQPAPDLAALPFIPARMFKTHNLKSVADAQVLVTIASSGTSGQSPSRVALDAQTIQLQKQALTSVLQPILGPERLPLLILDSAATLQHGHNFSARAAGILGILPFGRTPVFALNDKLELDRPALEAFLLAHGQKKFLVFGFTFMAYQYFYKAIAPLGYDLSHGLLLHSGGWKFLQQQAVNNAQFRQDFAHSCGLAHIYNFYGLTEQLGSLFLEIEPGLLYAPDFAEVIIRDPASLAPMPTGAAGLIQTLSLIPRSYPGHSLLTEDMGVIEKINMGPAGPMGKALRILGRAPQAEVRGCGEISAGAPA